MEGFPPPMLTNCAGDVVSPAPGRNIVAIAVMEFDDAPEAPLPRQRVSQQRYLMRRIGVLVVFTLLVVGVVKLVSAVVGADDTQASAPADTAGPAQSVVGTEGVADVTPSVADTAAPASSAPVVATRVPPTAENPARLLILGDSDAGAFGPYLETLMGETGIVTTALDYKVSSGLARPDFFDWPAHMAATVPAADPDIIVVTFGGNDAQALTDTSGAVLVGVPSGQADGDVEWRAEYARRVGAVMDYLTADGRSLVWVGIPNAADPDFTARLRVQDEAVRAEVAKRPGVRFVDTWQRFSGIEGGYAEFRVDPRDGQGKDVRADDGFHLNTNGAEILALDIAEEVRSELREWGAAL